MKYIHGIGYGVACWGIMVVFIFLFVALKQGDKLIFELFSAVIGGIAAYWLAGYLKPATMGTAFGYGVIFVVVGVILDLLITNNVLNMNVLAMWPMWVGYALVLLAPLLQVRKNRMA